jgi:hypothetical protein
MIKKIIYQVGRRFGKLKVSYCDSDIEEHRRCAKTAKREPGAESAKKLHRRLTELYAASVVTAQDYPHPLAGRRQASRRQHGPVSGQF